MYKIDRRGGGGSKNRSLGIYPKKITFSLLIKIENKEVPVNGTASGRPPGIDIVSQIHMDKFRRLGAPTLISPNAGLSVNNNNNVDFLLFAAL